MDPCSQPPFTLSQRVRDVFEEPPALLAEEDARRLIDVMQYKAIEVLRRPPALDSVTLSGSLTNTGSAWLELSSASIVNGETGLMEWLPRLDGTCHGEVYLHLPGAVAGASYIGQLRCRADVVHSPRDVPYVAVNVFGGKGGSQYGRLMVQQRQMVVPFLLSDVLGADPWIAFHPSGLRQWSVYDVSVRKL